MRSLRICILGLIPSLLALLSLPRTSAAQPEPVSSAKATAAPATSRPEVSDAQDEPLASATTASAAPAASSAPAATSRPGASTVPMTVDVFAPGPNSWVRVERPSYFPSLTWRGVWLTATYTMGASSIAAAVAAAYFEVDRASIAANHHAGTCHRSRLTHPSFCWDLEHHVAMRDILAPLAVVSALAGAAMAAVVVVVDTKTPVVVPVVGNEGGGLVLRGAW